MRWISIDAATRTGIAQWEGDRLLSVGTLRPVKDAKEAKALGLPKTGHVLARLFDGVRKQITFGDQLTAWSFELSGNREAVLEEPMGFQPKAIAQLAFRRGYITALCEARGIAVRHANTSSWRKAASETWGKTFPAKSEEAKALAIGLVEKHFGITCTDDEADAVLIGHWHLRTRA